MAVLNKQLCKRLFRIPHRQALADQEYGRMVGFLQDVMLGSGHECKDWVQDVAPFLRMFRPDWAKLYARRAEKRAAGVVEWPVFEEPSTLLFITHATNEQGWTVEANVEAVDLADWQAV